MRCYAPLILTLCPRGSPVRSVLLIATVVAMLLGSLGFAAPAAANQAGIKVAVIVGPVGEELTPVYIGLAEAAATAAETRGATVARAYSPNADQKSVRKAVRDANVVVYFGHGVGTPNPYSDTPSAATTNGWGLNGPGRRGDHSDSSADGSLAYYGESWIAQHARPAPGWVMIYSNACYAPGAGEGHHDPATQDVAATRVSAYSRGPLADLGASAYFATDFYEGAAHLVGALLDAPNRSYREIFMSEPRFSRDGLVMRPHASVAGAQTWLHKSPYFEGKLDYWYAFAGDPSLSLSGARPVADDPSAGTAVARIPDAPPSRLKVPEADADPIDGSITGMASSYGESVGWEGKPTVALPVQLGGEIPQGTPRYVVVCADRCVTMPVVDSCPCFFGTPEERVANLSHAAWRLISDAPLEEGLISVEITLSPVASRSGPPDR
jgi:hypothetical protein